MLEFIERNLAQHSLLAIGLALLVAQFVVRKMIKWAVISAVFLALVAGGVFLAITRGPGLS